MKLEQFEQRLLFAISPTLVSIQPNEGDVLLENQIRTVAPSELTLRFDEGQKLDAATISTSTIIVQRSGTDGIFGNAGDVTLTPSQVYVGLGDRPNEIIVRFSETLPDDFYRVTIVGAGQSPLRNTDGLAFNNGANLTRNFRLDLAPQVTAVVPQPITRGAGGLEQDLNRIDVYFNNDRLSSASAQNPALYQLINTRGTADSTDDTFINPVSVTYEAGNNRAVLRFASIPAGTYRLRIGDDSFNLANNQVTQLSPVTDPGSAIASATNAGTLTGKSVLIVGQGIDTTQSDAVQYFLQYPGGFDEPGHRDLPAGMNENHAGGGDGAQGITTYFYNFKRDYGNDPLGNPLVNQITENQKQRAREVFELYSHYLGVQFVETDDQGWTIATGDPRALEPTIPTGPGGVGGIAGGSLAIMNGAVNWGNSEFGGGWFTTAIHEIGHLLGLGHAYDLPAGTIMGGAEDLGSSTGAEPVFPGDYDIVHGQHLYRPESKDIDFYKFTLTGRGQFSAETIAERLANSSLLNSVITLYNATGQIIARNDDYFSSDSFIDLELDAGVYYIAVASTGNIQNDPNIADSGMGGTSQGAYQLRLNFNPIPSGSVLVDATGTRFDGDSDGRPGGVFNFWFQAASEENTIVVDKSAPTGGALGTLQNPYNNVQTALARAEELKQLNPDAPVIVRLVGNNGSDNNANTLGDNLAYEIGTNIFGQALSDGAEMNVPQGVTVMVEAGAIFKLRRANINAGSFAQGVDLSNGALQVLGTPQRQVYFTSYDNQTLGRDTNPLITTPTKGDWGGIVFRNDSDYETAGVFLNYVSHAQITYGGGSVVVDSIERVYNPIHLERARPTIVYNNILASADAVISADPNSFEETLYRGNAYTADYRRVGPDIVGNIFDARSTLTTADDAFPANSLNGLFVRIRTEAGIPIDTLDVSARFDDTDIVHVISENLLIHGTPGGPTLDGGVQTISYDARLAIDPGMIVKLQGSRIEVGIGAQLIAEGNSGNRVVFTSLFDDRYGAGGAFDTNNDLDETVPAVAALGDWGGLYYDILSTGSLDYVLITFAGGLAPIEGSFARFNPLEIRQADVRVANSIFERNANGLTTGNRNGRASNAEATIFVRGAQPIIVNNIFRNNEGDAININVNALNARSLPDYGRSTGAANLFDRFDDNYGPLVRLNRMGGNDVNGMAVRGGVLTTQSVWDDTDIVHVVREEIIVPNYHVTSGLRLQSSANESLVVKLYGAQAGFTASGTPLDINDRIGGSVWVLGTPGNPVILTSLTDNSVGAGFDLNGKPQVNTLDGGFATAEGASPASINYIIDPAVKAANAQQFAVMELAASIWEAILNDSVNINIDIDFEALPPNVLGGTFAQFAFLDYDLVRAKMIADAGPNEAALLAELPTFAQLQAQLPDNTYTLVPQIQLTRANAQALGFTDDELPSPVSEIDGVTVIDASITFSNEFEWDFDRSDGIDSGKQDFLAVAIHEIGHALGFISFVDDVDFGNTQVTLNPLDLFRLAPGQGAVDFTNAERVMTPGEDAVFFDGGQYNPQGIPIGGLTEGDIPLATGQVNGDGTQASHWKHRDFIGLTNPIGIMDPIVFPMGVITNADKRAFDLIGWDLVNRGGSPNDWRGVKLDENSNDRNVDIVPELESAYTGPTDTNSVPTKAQFVGTLAPNEENGDDVRRLGFEIHGAISYDRPGDVDIYSFNGVAGSEVWLDIDWTDVSLDSVIEVVNANGQVLARSNNSATETPVGFNGTRVFSMQRSDFSGPDLYTTNYKDAGLRLILPGTAGTTNTYYVRVRSNSPNLNDLSAGQTSGKYQLQVRLREIDEIPASTVRFADIRNAINAIDIQGMPGHSPLAVEATRGYTLNNGQVVVANTTFDQAQDVGNLLATDRNTIGIASALVNALDVDWYKFTLDFQNIQEIGGFSDGGWSWATVFDIDYADGMARPDLTLSVFDSLGNLIYIARDSNVTDDQPTPIGQASQDETRGTFGKLDPFLGTVQLPEGTSKTYYVAISSNAQIPSQLAAQFVNDAANKLVRLEPVNSVKRIVEDHIGFSGYESEGTQIDPVKADGILPIQDVINLQTNVRPFELSDVTLFVSQDSNITALSTLYTVDPYTGSIETTVGAIGGGNAPGAESTQDLVMRSDGMLFGTQTTFSDASGGPEDNAGRLIQIDPGNAQAYLIGRDEIPEPGDEPNPDQPDELFTSFIDALTYTSGFRLAQPGESDDYFDLFYSVRSSVRNISRLYYAEPTNGNAQFDEDDFFPGPAGGTLTSGYITDGRPDADFGRTTGMAIVERQTVLLDAPAGALILDGQFFSVTDGNNTVRTFEFNLTGGVTGGRIPVVVTNGMTADEVADAIVAAIQTSGLAVDADAFGDVIDITGAFGANSGTSQVQVDFVGVELNLFGVSNTGLFYRIDFGTGQATVLADFGRARSFAGLALGPQNLYDGAYSTTLFAITSNGDLYAIDPVSATFRTDVFAGGAEFVSTGVSNATGLAFSPLDFNMWHPTTQGSTDPGHGIFDAPDNSRDTLPLNQRIGGASYYFGLENVGGGYLSYPQVTPYGTRQESSQYGVLRNITQHQLTAYSAGIASLPSGPAQYADLAAAVALGNNYNTAGGAHGSLITDEFSLFGYSKDDKPVLYFNYFLETQNANGAAMRDAARVFISKDDGATWEMIATNNSALNFELPQYLTVNSEVGSGDDRQQVQEMFDTVADAEGVLSDIWRQARVDLSKYAGQSSLKLRFDFSTAGDISDPSNPLHPETISGDQFGGFGSATRGQANAFKGFYIDDIIVGFTERGEMVTSQPLPGDPSEPVPPDTSFLPVFNPALLPPGTPTQTLVGAYQLEIRRGAEYGEANKSNGRLAINPAGVQDTNYRFTQTISLTTPTGAAINDGESFSLSDGVNVRVFEFNSTGGVTNGNIAIAYNTGFSSQQMANAIRSAINSQNSASFKVSAGVTDNRVDVVGAARANNANSPTLGVARFDVLGDSNHFRDQGMIVIQNNKISNSGQYGILADGAPREGAISRPGAAGNLYVLNNERLVPGIAISNNLIVNSGAAGIKFSGESNVGTDAEGNPVLLPNAVVPFGRIMNNTIYGSGFGIGILVTDNASPTLLNNIVSSLVVGIQVDPSSASAVLGANLYHNNQKNTEGTGLGSFPLTLAANELLFVDAGTGNFRLAAGSKAIDSSINTLQDRPSMIAVANPLGIGQSPIVTPTYDLAGQVRVDDPTVASPPGLGSNVFKDRGAFDRSDFGGPTARLVTPLDNDTAGFDLDADLNEVFYAAGQPAFFDIQLDDNTGSGIDLTTVTSDKFNIFRRKDATEPWVELVEGVDYTFGYDATNDIVRFTPVVGLWLSGFDYRLQIENIQPNGVRDLAGNFLQPNNLEGTILFDITIKEIDFGDAPDPTYPTLRDSDGARHIIVPDRVENGNTIKGVYLGERINSDAEGRQSSAADGDDGDDGVVFNNRWIPGATASITVTASVAGKVNAWIDWNNDGDWDDAGENVFNNVNLVAGENDLNINVPVTSATSVFGRFRFSTAGGLTPTGIANDGEVEDYRIEIPPVIAYTVKLVNPGDGQELPKDASGIYIVLPGQSVRVNVYVNDTREGLAQGVFSAFADLGYNVDSMDFVGNLLYGGDFPNSRSGNVDELGQLIDEAGGVGPVTSPGTGERLLYGVLATIKPSAALGSTFIISLDEADLSPIHDSLVYGLNQEVAASYGKATVKINEKPWQNPANRMDVNGDGRITSLDALNVINRLNSGGPGPLPTPSGGNPPPFYDVNGDGAVTTIDALQIINYLNLPTVTIAASDANAGEPSNPGAFVISRTGATTQQLQVNVVISGSATSGTDYTAITTPVVIPAGSTSVTININPIDDLTQELAETVVLTIATNNAYKLGATTTATVTIADNDSGGSAALPLVAASLPDATENFSADTLLAASALPVSPSVVVSQDLPSAGPLVRYSLADAAFATGVAKPATAAALPMLIDELFDDEPLAETSDEAVLLEVESLVPVALADGLGAHEEAAAALFALYAEEELVEELVPAYLGKSRKS